MAAAPRLRPAAWSLSWRKAKRPTEAFLISQQDVLDALGGLPDESVHCALLAANTLKQAVQDYLAFRNEPWKRAYRKR